MTQPLVCAVITENTIESARRAIKHAAGVADVVEVRLDYLRDLDFSSIESLRPLLEDKPLPIIITCRARSEGGNQQIADDLRIGLLVEGARRLADYCDIEAAYYASAARLRPDPSRLIVSYHNFTDTPADLDAVYERVCALPAAVHKIVTRAGDLSDALPIFRLLGRGLREQRKLIALAMGEAGQITRLLGPSRGCYLTYAALGRGGESAPGQLTCEELVRGYRIHRISRDTAITGIIGKPVGHSASPAMHNRAFGALGLDFAYLPIEVRDLPEFFARFVRPETREMDWSLRGLSVTFPYKQAVLPLVDELDATAREVGAVNTLVISDGRIKGYNTDVQGAIGPLEMLCRVEGESFGVIGAGGAARAVIYGLRTRGGRVTVFARDPARARPLATEFGVTALPLEALGASDVRVVINTTPAGMRGHAEGTSPVSPAALAGRQIAYDLVYNPLETRFLKDARRQGCQVISGIEMLVAQAALQFELWTGRRPPVDLMREAAISKVTSDKAGPRVRAPGAGEEERD